MELRTARLLAAMAEYDAGDARRIQHFVKVAGYAAAIGAQEGLDACTQAVLEAAALLHDVGIHASEQKYGSCAGPYQEREGPAEARKVLAAAGGYTEAETQRICWLIAHHHTYTNIDAADYRMLVEADFLVNLCEDEASSEAVAAARKNIFRTRAGLALLDALFPQAH